MIGIIGAMFARIFAHSASAAATSGTVAAEAAGAAVGSLPAEVLGSATAAASNVALASVASGYLIASGGVSSGELQR